MLLLRETDTFQNALQHWREAVNTVHKYHFLSALSMYVPSCMHVHARMFVSRVCVHVVCTCSCDSVGAGRLEVQRKSCVITQRLFTSIVY